MSIWPVVFQIRALTTFPFLQIVSQLLEKWPHPPCTPSKPEKRKEENILHFIILMNFSKKREERWAKLTPS